MIKKISILVLSLIISQILTILYFINFVDYKDSTYNLRVESSYVYQINQLLIKINHCPTIYNYLNYLKESSFYYKDTNKKLNSIMDSLSKCELTKKDYLYLTQKITNLTEKEVIDFTLQYWNVLDGNILEKNIKSIKNTDVKTNFEILLKEKAILI